MAEFIQVVTTVEEKDDAQKIASSIVGKRLAGCVQIIGPITSTYWWENEIETAQEWLCVIKSRKDLYEDLEQAIHQVHPYDVPEILATPVIAGSRSYLTWLNSELEASARREEVKQ